MVEIELSDKHGLSVFVKAHKLLCALVILVGNEAPDTRQSAENRDQTFVKHPVLEICNKLVGNAEKSVPDPRNIECINQSIEESAEEIVVK